MNMDEQMLWENQGKAGLQEVVEEFALDSPKKLMTKIKSLLGYTKIHGIAFKNPRAYKKFKTIPMKGGGQTIFYIDEKFAVKCMKQRKKK